MPRNLYQLFRLLAVGLLCIATLLYLTDSIGTARLAAHSLHRTSVQLLHQLGDRLTGGLPLRGARSLSAAQWRQLRAAQDAAQNPAYFVHDTASGVVAANVSGGGRPPHGCSMPAFPVHSPLTARHYGPYKRPVACPSPLTASEPTTGWLWLSATLDRSELAAAFGDAEATAERVICHVVQMVRHTDTSNTFLDSATSTQRLTMGKRVRVATGVRFVRVQCGLLAAPTTMTKTTAKSRKVDEYHFFVHGETANDGRSNATKSIDDSATESEPGSEPVRRQPNVLLIGVDSISRLNFHRQMPRTARRLLDRLDAVEMLGYNKIGDNTYPNTMAVLTGLDSDAGELKAACQPQPTKNTFDECRFIWDVFASAAPTTTGYRTAFAEDVAAMGVFNFNLRGFRRQPVDELLRPLIVELEHHQTELGIPTVVNGQHRCLGARRPIDWLFAWASAVVKRARHQRRPLFGWFWSSAHTHDFFNQAQAVDADYAQLIDEWTTPTTEGNENGTTTDDIDVNDVSADADNNFVILHSDHGLRWGAFRQTYQGAMEERQPLLALRPPRWFAARFPAAYGNLLRNRHRLTTPFDLYETLRDLADLEASLGDAAVARRAERLAASEPQPRGISLFLPVPERRTCAQAGVAPHWCTCHERRAIARTDARVQRAARFVVERVNALLRPHRSCMRLSLHSIADATVAITNGEIVAKTSTSNNNKAPVQMEHFADVRVSLCTKPGLAELEATVRMPMTTSTSTKKAGGVESALLELAGPISRTNAYDKQSACVDDVNVKLFCYCDSFM